jgi:uncharacterized protein (DUF488 family)
MIYTVGHSNQALDAFLAILSAHSIRQLADVRRVPYSRRHPQFGRQSLSDSLESHGVAYRHFPRWAGSAGRSPIP